jgi:hypothetical protein
MIGFRTFQITGIEYYLFGVRGLNEIGSMMRYYTIAEGYKL